MSLTVVANRLPVQFDENGRALPSPGGLVAALGSVIEDGDRWIGWGEPGSAGPLAFGDVTLDIHPIELSDTEVEGYYDGFANSVLWPLFHGRIRPVDTRRTQWRVFDQVNRRFAAEAAAVVPPGGTVWIHDYHLLLVPGLLRRRRPDVRIGFFLHIPFPPAQLFASLPWRRELIAGVLGADLIGFQVQDDVDNFLAAADRCLGVTVVDQAVRRAAHDAHVGAFPISIDFAKWDALGTEAAPRAVDLRAQTDSDTLLLGIERLDYTKGVPQRIQAFGELLDEGALQPDNALLMQVAVPSRVDVPAYQEARDDVHTAVQAVNDRHPRSAGGGPVRYEEEGMGEDELAAWYRAADIMLVTSLADGMNLVAKEFVAARGDHDGVLILSEFAGAVHELGCGAVIVNPYDVEAMKFGLWQALHLTPMERATRMAAMRDVIRGNDVHRWARTFLDRLNRLTGAHLSRPAAPPGPGTTPARHLHSAG